MGRGVRRFTELRAWQACVAYKKAVYRLCEQPPLANDWKRRSQLEDSVWGPPGHLAEGYGRFNPPDFARFVVIARSSLMESQSHLMDCVDRGYISEATRLKLDALAEAALMEVTGLLEYLQSEEALRNARRARERRIASRLRRQTDRSLTLPPTPRVPREQENLAPGTEPRTRTPEPRNPEPGSEPARLRAKRASARSRRSLRRRRKHEQGSQNPEE